MRFSFMQLLLMGFIRAYQILSWPLYTFFGTTGACRFTPTCSRYAMEAVQKHGAWTGFKLALRRVLRCHPWGGSGPDPVP